MERIESQDQFKNMMAGRTDAVTREEQLRFDHAAIASQAIKIINSVRIDPFVQKVMTLRIMGPLVTGRERSHMSIALELGAPVDDVIQAEQYGMKIIEELMQKVSNEDFINKYNSDRAVDNAVKQMRDNPVK